jgi:hypothetical protein
MNLKKPKKYMFEHFIFKSKKKSIRAHTKSVKTKFFGKRLKKKSNKLTPKSIFFTKIKKKLTFKKLPTYIFARKVINSVLTIDLLKARIPKSYTRKMKKKNIKSTKRFLKLNKALSFKKKNFVRVIPFPKKFKKSGTIYKMQINKIFKNNKKKKLLLRLKKNYLKKKLFKKKTISVLK